MKTLRLQLRFLLPLAVALVVAAYIALPLLDQVTLRWFSRDLNSRGALMVNAMSDAMADALLDPRTDRLATLLDRAVQDERLFAIAACDAHGVLLHATRAFPDGLSCPRGMAIANRVDPRLRLAGGPVHVGVHNVMRMAQEVAAEQGPEGLIGRG
ncbi:MAG TPA: trehalose-6-phosphate synthase, partial [Burkholderiaceae bacterium]|nr:trehalose-6-phosphate synthase [Burkholderiaceae bacterium]